MYKVELRSKRRRRLKDSYMEKHHIRGVKRIQNGKYAVHYERTIADDKLNAFLKQCRKAHLTCTWYDTKYSRSNTYRYQFFANNTGPYRCRYCHKLLDKDLVTVDHLIPVNATKNSFTGKMALKMQKCSNVNDIKNLVPSCSRCNQKKSSKMGLWYIRGRLGNSSLYWIILRTLQISLVLVIIWLAYTSYKNPDAMKDIILNWKTNYFKLL